MHDAGLCKDGDGCDKHSLDAHGVSPGVVVNGMLEHRLFAEGRPIEAQQSPRVQKTIYTQTPMLPSPISAFEENGESS
jgi:hypothetical protein